MAQNKPHAVVLAFPEIGHVTPLARLSFKLSSMDYVITMLSTASFAQASSFESRLLSLLPPPSLQSQLGLDIRLVQVPFHIDPQRHPMKALSSDSHLGNIFLLIEMLQQQQGILEALITSLRPPVTCIISDTFLFWTKDLALSLNIPRALFWTASATMLVNSAKPQEETSQSEEDACLQFTRHPLVSLFTKKQFGDISDARCLLVNSFEDLEDKAREEAGFPIPLHPIGPLLPHPDHLQTEEIEIVRWLDSKETCSVIYIAFGSVFTFQEIEELAAGIEASKKPFLWVFKEDSDQERQSSFTESMKAKGLIVPWAPQVRVLTHPSVGCFITHCGWNSAVEAISSGVPMLCCPLFGDQILNSHLVVKKWQVGIEAKRKEDGSIDTQEFERGIRVLMESEEGKEIRRRCEKMRERARLATMDGGSSDSHLRAFMKDVAA